MHKRFGFLVILLCLWASLAQAQEPLTATTVGPITVTHAPSWNIFAGPGDTVVMAEFDPTLITTENPVPPDAVIVQLRLFGLNRVAGLLEDELTPYNIAGGLLMSDPTFNGELPEITAIDGATYTFARVDLSSDTLASYVYVTVFNDVTFGIITTSSTSGTELLNTTEPRILELLDTVTLHFETPFLAEAFTRYALFPRSLTPEGFPLLGSPDASVSVQIITSYDCDDCRLFHDEFFPLLFSRMSLGEINIVLLPIYGTGSIPAGDSAARAALCVGTENFWSFQDMLFAWQDFGGFAFSYERLQAGAANTVGIPPATFDDCYTSPATNAVLEAARQTTFSILGQEWRTPTVIVNGAIVQPLNLEQLLTAIDDALDGVGQ
jgi:protein-disulfide isomerase